MPSDELATDHVWRGAEREVRALYQALLNAWNCQSAEQMAGLLADDGNMVGFDGSLLNGPIEIESTLRNIFANHPTAEFVSIVREVRLLSADVALLRAVVGMVPRGTSELNPAVNAVQSLVAQRRDGAWRIALFHNTPAAFHGRPEDSARLTAELTQVVRSRSS